MLVNFRVENYKSFKDFTEFSMETTALKNLVELNTFSINKASLLKSAVIYGANASGKSNLLAAMSKMKWLVKSSFDIERMKKYLHEPFLLNTETENNSTTFEIEFIISETLYRYGFEINADTTIQSEWLYQKKLKRGARPTELFFRNKQGIKIGSSFKEGKSLEDKTRENTLFLLIVAQFNGEISNLILHWFDEFNVISNIENDGFKYYSFDMLENLELKEKVVNFIKSADTGISDIEKKKVSFDELEIELGKEELKDLPDDFLSKLKEDGLSEINTIHMQYDKNNAFKAYKPFNLKLESDGTQNLLALAGPIIDTLIEGSTLVIDELDNSMHTELVEAIIKLFNSKETNPNNAQLIFTTHDTNLLNQNIFRRDQIWFAQKDIYGVSELYSLVEYGKGTIRDDLVLEKNYLAGKFGGKPHISSLAYEEN